ncbi:MAG TPA: glycosyltransferase [Sandaracinaceae bacterium LLY-WYZ-13_1]|nr:glycosyltransferase [Sandaracinaceae bacterium LLY-WYZ-13_1]
MPSAFDGVPGFADLPLRRRLRARLLWALQTHGAGPARAVRDALPSSLARTVRRALAPAALRDAPLASLPVDALPPEPTAAPRAGHPEASIVIPSRAAPTLAQCLRAVAAHTRRAHEVIVVDDAADTPLDRIAGATVLRNPTRRGFVASANRGAGAARADVLVFLNDDALVTPGWLGALLDALRDAPGAGLVGPASNATGDAATFDVAYRDLDGLLRVARERRGPLREVPKLSLFCAAIPAALFERVGGLDEGYGLGLFEDDDLCMALRRRGRRVLLVPDAFVHHHGSTSFARLGDAARLARFEVNRRRFEAKWRTRWRAPRP